MGEVVDGDLLERAAKRTVLEASFQCQDANGTGRRKRIVRVYLGRRSKELMEHQILKLGEESTR